MSIRRYTMVWVLLGIFLASVFAAGCGLVSDQRAGTEDRAASEELVIYSGRREQFVLPLIETFERETGITVRLLSGSATQYALRILDETSNPQADLFLANDAGVMEKLRIEGALDAYDSPSVEQIPADFNAEDGSWLGLSARARILMYNIHRISEEEMPQSIFDLADPRFARQFAITRAGNESMISHLTAIRIVHGDAALEDLLRGILANEPEILSGHTDIRKAVGSGEFAFGLVNNYYYHLQLMEETDNRVAAIYPDQGEGEMGTFVNIAGVALVRGGPNRANAERFLEFLLEPEQLASFPALNYETPVLPNVPTVDIARPIDTYRRADIDLASLGPAWDETIEVMDRAGYSE